MKIWIQKLRYFSIIKKSTQYVKFKEKQASHDQKKYECNILFLMKKKKARKFKNSRLERVVRDVISCETFLHFFMVAFKSVGVGYLKDSHSNLFWKKLWNFSRFKVQRQFAIWTFKFLSNDLRYVTIKKRLANFHM